MGYYFEKIENDKIGDLVTIFHAAYGKEISSVSFEKKLDTAFTGLSYVGYIAYEEETNEPAGFYGVYPCFCDYQGKKYLVAQSGDTMTHPKHQGKGLFTALATKTYEYSKENNVHLVFGFPNENSYPGFVKKLNWVHFDDIEAFIKKVTTISWYRINKHLGLSQNTHQKWINIVTKKHLTTKIFASSCKDNDTPVILHDNDYFDYKAGENNFLLEIKGVSVVVKITSDYIYIGDIEKCAPFQLKKVVAALERLAAILFIPHIRFQGSTRTNLHTYFSQNYTKIESKYPAGGVAFSNEIPIEKIKFTLLDYDTF